MRLLGSILYALGILIAGASGLCTLVFMDEILTDPAMTYGGLTMGLVPFMIGMALIFAGRSIRRREDARAGSEEGGET